MARMFRMLSFWTGAFAVLFYVGNMFSMSMLFFLQTGALLALGWLNLSERTYMYLFGAYLTIFFVGFTYYSTFLLEPRFGL